MLYLWLYICLCVVNLFIDQLVGVVMYQGDDGVFQLDMGIGFVIDFFVFVGVVFVVGVVYQFGEVFVMLVEIGGKFIWCEWIEYEKWVGFEFVIEVGDCDVEIVCIYSLVEIGWVGCENFGFYIDLLLVIGESYGYVFVQFGCCVNLQGMVDQWWCIFWLYVQRIILVLEYLGQDVVCG